MLFPEARALQMATEAKLAARGIPVPPRSHRLLSGRAPFKFSNCLENYADYKIIRRCTFCGIFKERKEVPPHIFETHGKQEQLGRSVVVEAPVLANARERPVTSWMTLQKSRSLES